MSLCAFSSLAVASSSLWASWARILMRFDTSAICCETVLVLLENVRSSSRCCFWRAIVVSSSSTLTSFLFSDICCTSRNSSMLDFPLLIRPSIKLSCTFVSKTICASESGWWEMGEGTVKGLWKPAPKTNCGVGPLEGSWDAIAWFSWMTVEVSWDAIAWFSWMAVEVS